MQPFMVIQAPGGNDWTAPTDDHNNLKAFMQDQIKISADFDRDEPDRPVMIPINVFRKDIYEGLKRDVEYYAKQLNTTVERAEVNTEWVTQLRESLK